MAFWVYEQKMGVDDWMTTRAPVVTKKNSKALQLQCRLPEFENAKPEGSVILSSREYSDYPSSHTLVDMQIADLMFWPNWFTTKKHRQKNRVNK